MKEQTPQYFLILGDIQNSRKIKNRPVFEQKLQEAIKWVEIHNQNEFILPIKHWKGIDEIAGVCKNINGIYWLIQDINRIIYPERMRFVGVFGEINGLNNNNRDISQLDGNAFIEASTLMQELKKEGSICKMKALGEEKDWAISNQINAVALIKQRWTAKQFEIYHSYFRTGSQNNIATKMGISQQSVSKTLKAIKADEVMNIERKISTWNVAFYRI